MEEPRLRMENLVLTEEEEAAVVILDPDEIAKADKELEKSAACKILANRTINVQTFKTLIPEIWRVEGKVKIQSWGRNMYLCTFEDTSVKEKVIANGPWIYDKSIILFENVRGMTIFTDLKFQYASFWVRFHNLPLICFSKEMARGLGNLIGDFEDTDIGDDHKGWGSHLRVKVRIDINKPLRRGLTVKVGSTIDPFWVRLSYEKLPKFCFGCGKLGHSLKWCNEFILEEGRETPFGPELRHSSIHGR